MNLVLTQFAGESEVCLVNGSMPSQTDFSVKLFPADFALAKFLSRVNAHLFGKLTLQLERLFTFCIREVFPSFMH